MVPKLGNLISSEHGDVGIVMRHVMVLMPLVELSILAPPLRRRMIVSES